MKRFFLLLLAVALILASFVGLTLPTNAATLNGEQVYFTVINDSLLDLDPSTMPALLNGKIYVPYTLFNTYFRITASYSASNQVLFLSDSVNIVKFDIANGISYDRNLNIIRQTAVIHHGQVYVPAAFVANYFSLGYYLISSAGIVRLTDASATYPDAFLPSQFADRMEEMLREQTAAATTVTANTTVTTASAVTQTTMQTTAVTQTTTVKTSVSTILPSKSSTAVTSAVTTSAVETTTTTTIPRQVGVTLSFLVSDTDNLDALLDYLEQNQISACFYLTGTDVNATAAVLASGHSLGAWLQKCDSRSASFDYSCVSEANQIGDCFYRVVRLRPHWIWMENPSTQNLTALSAAGYERLPLIHVTAENEITVLLESASTLHLLLSDCDADSVAATVSALKQNGAFFLPASVFLSD